MCNTSRAIMSIGHKLLLADCCHHVAYTSEDNGSTGAQRSVALHELIAVMVAVVTLVVTVATEQQWDDRMIGPSLNPSMLLHGDCMTRLTVMNVSTSATFR